MNTEISMKKLRLHTPKLDKKSKCHKLHVGKDKSNCKVLQVHGFEMEDVDIDNYFGR